ncbi:MAG TPA: hypothetical protein PKN50_14725 [Spirochaetota bacterium]|nr:hypothetical protein [Spirochaetota bacterium]HPV40121.1 hypothetical protein [Spirochaetota bacterium]
MKNKIPILLVAAVFDLVSVVVLEQGGEIQRYIVNKNRVLRYAETGGTDYWTNGVDSFYAGSHNPHDTKRVYIKAEVAF